MTIPFRNFFQLFQKVLLFFKNSKNNLKWIYLRNYGLYDKNEYKKNCPARNSISEFVIEIVGKEHDHRIVGIDAWRGEGVKGQNTNGRFKQKLNAGLVLSLSGVFNFDENFKKCIAQPDFCEIL